MLAAKLRICWKYLGKHPEQLSQSEQRYLIELMALEALYPEPSMLNLFG